MFYMDILHRRHMSTVRSNILCHSTRIVRFPTWNGQSSGRSGIPLVSNIDVLHACCNCGIDPCISLGVFIMNPSRDSLGDDARIRTDPSRDHWSPMHGFAQTGTQKSSLMNADETRWNSTPYRDMRKQEETVSSSRKDRTEICPPKINDSCIRPEL